MEKKKVWKYEIEKSKKIIPIPSLAVRPLWVKFQRNEYGDGLYVWIELIPGEKKYGYTFYYIMTGREVPNGATYIGSAEDPKTHEICHVYWKAPEEFIKEDEFGSL